MIERTRLGRKPEFDDRMPSVLTGVSAGLGLNQSCRDAGIRVAVFQRWRSREPAHVALYNDALERGRYALRLRLIELVDSPLISKRQRNRECWAIESMLHHSYNDGRPRST